MELFEFLFGLFVFLIGFLIAAFLLSRTLKIYPEYERGVRFRLGRFNKVIGPGISYAIPYIDSAITVDTRSKAFELPELKVMTKEKATVFVDLIVRYSIASPELSVTKASNAENSLKAVAETAVRNGVGELAFSDLVGKREFINARLRETVASQAEQWGLAVDGVELTEITPSERALELINKSLRKGKKRQEGERRD